MNSWSTLQLGLRIVKNGRRTYRTMTSRRVGAVQKWTSFSDESARNLSTQEQNVVKSPYPDISVPDITLVDFVWDMVDKFPDSTALVSTDIMDGFARLVDLT